MLKQRAIESFFKYGKMVERLGFREAITEIVLSAKRVITPLNKERATSSR
jgi:hypothetical protein